jgi:uncharacterized delta-60 repeat protein
MHPIEPLEPRTLLTAGEIDTTFANGTTSVLGPGDDAAYAIAALPDGGFVTAGKTRGPSAQGVGLVRYRADGTLQISFGRAGQVFVPVDGYDKPVLLAVQPDGKILLAGSATEKAELIRLSPDGKLDDTFGVGGIVVTDLGPGFDEPLAIIVRPDGRVLMLGSATLQFRRQTVLVQFTTSGQLDSSFGAAGKASFGAPGAAAYFADVKLLPDGRIMAVGSNDDRSIVARLDPSGRLDPTFGQTRNGIDAFAYASAFKRVQVLRDGSLLAATFQQNYVTLQHRRVDGSYSVFGSLYFPGSVDDISDIVIQHGGKIVIAATIQLPDAATGNTTRRLAVARFGITGFPDSSFGNNGVTLVDLPAIDSTGGPAIALLPRGRLVVTAPPSYTLAPRDFETAALTRNGHVNIAMGAAGHLVTDILSPINSSFDSLAPLPDGRFLALENVAEDSLGVRILRFDANGRIDPSFHGGTPLDVDFGALGEPYVGHIVVNASGDRFAVVTSLTGSTDPNALLGGGVAMFNADGTPDQTFGNLGIVTFQHGEFPTSLTTGLFQGDRLLVAGKIQGSFGLARFKMDGSLDKSFGDAGVTITRINPIIEEYSRTTQVVAFALDAKGRILALGNDNLVLDLSGDNALAMARYTPDGRLDKTFGQGGIVGGLDDPSAWHGFVTNFRIQDDGRIDVVGSSLAIYPYTLDSAVNVLRFNADGSPDQAFGNAGRKEINFGPYVDNAADLFIQSDGKLVLVGITNYDGPYPDIPQDIALARLDRNGQLDASFGAGGKTTSSVGNTDQVNSAFMLSDGRIILAGESDHQPLLAGFLLTGPDTISARLAKGTLKITGTSGPDTIRLQLINGRIHVTNAFATFDPASFSRIAINALAGNDTVDASASPVPITLIGGEGNDLLLGGRFADLLQGNAGNDTLFGGQRNDRLYGDDGNDYLNPGPGIDQVSAGNGNDQLFSLDHERDTLDAGPGHDRAKTDQNDLLTNSESPLI